MERVSSLSSCLSRLDADRAARTLPSVVSVSPDSGSTIAVPRGHVAILEMHGTGWAVTETDRILGGPTAEIVGGNTRLSFRTDGLRDTTGAHQIRLKQGSKAVRLTIDVQDVGGRFDVDSR